MRVRDLRGAFDEVRTIFKSAGAKSQEKAFDQISSALVTHDDVPVETYFSSLRRAAEDAAAPVDQQYAKRLNDAGFNEGAFLKVLSEIQSDTKIKKTVLQKIVKSYTGSFDKRSNANKLIDELKATFYTRIYERDSREMARRATPV